MLRKNGRDRAADHDAPPSERDAPARILPVDTTMIAPSLANIIDVKPPADLDGTCFDLGFPGAPKCMR
jgi:hypothetical protein